LKELIISSSAFERNKLIPAKYTCDGANVNPPLQIEGIPEEAKALVLIVEDPDASMGLWIHWVVWNIPPESTISENSIPGIEGLNSGKKRKYGGPCPPSGTHRYFFKVYALDTRLELKGDSQKREVEKAIENHVLAEGELVGLYSR
jgi:Raf kinase inhibitor-like YbhB/YbcL family protein